MSQKKSSMGRALVQTVAGKEVSDAIFDLAEVALDQNLADGLIKDVPIVGTLVKIARARESVSEALFLRKLERFLSDLDSVSTEERERLLEKYPDSSEEQGTLGENLLLALDRLDDIKKPAIMARFFTAYVKQDIDYLTFTRLVRALEKFNIELLPNLSWFYTRQGPIVETPEEFIHELSLAGLVTVSLALSGTIGGSAGYRYSELGKKFLQIGFGIQSV